MSLSLCIPGKDKASEFQTLQEDIKRYHLA